MPSPCGLHTETALADTQSQAIERRNVFNMSNTSTQAKYNGDGACEMAESRREAILEGLPSPLRAIRLHCLECCAGNPSEVRLCPSSMCHLWPCRFGKRPETAQRQGKLVQPELAPVKPAIDGAVTPRPKVHKNGRFAAQLRAILWHCQECAGGRGRVKHCNIVDCPLWRFRFGIRPQTAARQGKAVHTADADGMTENSADMPGLGARTASR